MLASGLRGRLHLHTQGVLTALSGDPGNLVALLVELSIKGLRILNFQDGIFAAVNSRAGRIGSCAIQQFLLALLDQLLLEGDLRSRNMGLFSAKGLAIKNAAKYESTVVYNRMYSFWVLFLVCSPFVFNHCEIVLA